MKEEKEQRRDRKKKTLLDEDDLEDEDLEGERIKAITEAVKTLLEQEEPEVREKAEKILSKKFYTKELNIKEAIWEIEEIAGDPHKLVVREFPLGKFASFEEAQAWAVERDGVCLGQQGEKWIIKYDPIRAKRLKERKKRSD